MHIPSLGRKFGCLCALLSVLLLSLPQTSLAAEKKDFKFAWSIYAGFMPWAYAEKSGILKKWADKYGIKIDLVQINDYVESINQYTAGQFDGVLATNMDALTIPAAGGVDTTVLLMGDYSDGNDGVVLKGKGKTLADIKGMQVYVVQYSVSHYLLARALQSIGLRENDISTINISDADFVASYTTKDAKAVVAWNPGLAEIVKSPDASLVFNSTQIPGEIMDIAVVNTDTLKDNPSFGKALTGAWFETLALMRKDDAKGKEARAFMGAASGTDLAGFDGQLKTTHLFYDPKEAVEFTRSQDVHRIMELVRTFCFEHGLMGTGTTSKDAIGITLPNKVTLGDAKNIKLRFDDVYMSMAADGKL